MNYEWHVMKMLGRAIEQAAMACFIFQLGESFHEYEQGEYLWYFGDGWYPGCGWEAPK